MEEKSCSETLRKVVVLVARKSGVSMRQIAEFLTKYYDVDVELFIDEMALYEADSDAGADANDLEELAELEEARPEPPYQVFFVRTVSRHLIPWYTSGFQ